MSVTASATLDHPPTIAGEPRRAPRSTTTTILVRGSLVWLGWLWATLLVVLTIGLLVVAASGWNPSTSLWSGGGIGWQRWVLFSSGVALTRVFPREFVTRGVTRRRLAESAIAAITVVAAICGAVGAAGYVIEAAVFRAQDWSHGLPGGATFAAGDLPRLTLEYALLGIVYYLGGWILGLGYLRYHWASATLLLPVCLVPVALIELTVSHVTSNFRLGALPEALQDPSLLVTLAAAVPVVAATAVVASRLTRSVPLR